MDYVELDRRISEILNLPQGCIFVLNVHLDEKSLEFVYPSQLKGNIFPVNNKSIAGCAAAAKRSYISNNVREETGFILFDLLMSRGGAPIQKMITYPVIFTDKAIAVLQVTRRGNSLSESGPNFQKEDLEKIKSVLDDTLTLHVVKSAQRK